MKRTNTLTLFAILLTCLFFAEYVDAQTDGLVEISNKSGEKRKICMYGNDDLVLMAPSRCFEIRNGEKVMWNRPRDFDHYFQVKIFKSQLIDKYLYTRRIPGKTTTIVIGSGDRFGSSQAELKPAVTKYRLKVCNQRFNQEIYFAVSFETNAWFVTEGWWSVKKGQCVELAVSDRLKRSISLNYGNLPQTYYYAESYGDNPQYWAGGSSGRSLCVNDRKAFEIMLIRGPGGNPIPGACDQSGQKVVSFRRIDTPKANEEYYYLTF